MYHLLSPGAGYNLGNRIYVTICTLAEKIRLCRIYAFERVWVLPMNSCGIEAHNAGSEILWSSWPRVIHFLALSALCLLTFWLVWPRSGPLGLADGPQLFMISHPNSVLIALAEFSYWRFPFLPYKDVFTCYSDYFILSILIGQSAT